MNCTYFDSDTPTAGKCQVEICPCGDDICQVKKNPYICVRRHCRSRSIFFKIRLDFVNFQITGPSTTSTCVSLRQPRSGAFAFETPPAANRVFVANQGQCTVDTFSVTNPTGTTPPTICGTNTGEHSEKGD